jgi:CheY-like chemotaxis protein/HPt (histidine-containing phosphotransfer) domain-containing protein
MTLDSVSFDPRALLEEVTDLLVPRAHQKGLSIYLRVDPEVPGHIVGDPVRIRQVLTNLAGNAVKFTDKGEVKLELKLVSEPAGSARLRIAVSDTGIGIRRENQDRVFESFTQVEGDCDRKHGGTGLGLTICRHLVALMDGKIGLDSIPGKGSTFWFEIPLVRGAGADDAPELTKLSGLRVLVVDNDVTDRDIACEALRSWNCRPGEAASCAQALARLEAAADDAPYGLVLVAEDLPDCDAEQTAWALKGRERFADLPRVLLTSKAPRPPGRGPSDLYSATLTKPLRSSHLYNILCHIIASVEKERLRELERSAERKALLAPLRVLLAEDNDINRRVAVGMVERLGCSVEYVTNGKRAVEAFDRSEFDLILMDVQMPEMDGYRATAAIRKREEATGTHIPIIAMTAHAMQVDRRRCLEAGMDDHLAKPIRPGPLREVLLRWGTAGSPLEDCTPTYGAAEWAWFSPAFLIGSCGGDFDMVREILVMASATIPERLERIRAAIDSFDGPQVAWEAHDLKAVFLAIGAESLGASCQELRSLGDGAASTDLEERFRLIDDHWHRLSHELNQFCLGRNWNIAALETSVRAGRGAHS